MPEGRPAIPIEIKREVLFQARQRCAVCCEPTPLENAHIDPWNETQDNTAPNLIALCASCHARADKEHWGASQLRRYKQEPCALQRDRLPPLTGFQKALVDLIIATDPETMTEKERLRLVSMVAAYADISVSDVSVKLVEPANSTRVRLELPATARDKLLSGFQAADPLLRAFLDGFDLLRLESPPAVLEENPEEFTYPLIELAPIIDIYVGPTSAYSHALRAAGVPVPQPVRVRALIDTGFTGGLMVSQEVIRPLALKTRGWSQIGFPRDDNPRYFALYTWDVDASVKLINPGHGKNILLELPVTVVEHIDSRTAQALIGQEILKSCTLTYDPKRGVVKLAF